MNDKLKYRTPTAEDGTRVWELIKAAGTLDLNSAYCYLMLCDYFRDTCVIAEREGEVVGFLSSFPSPLDKRTLFVWQIAVAQDCRKQGIGLRMLTELMNRDSRSTYAFIETTISPDNTGSRNLFYKLSEKLNAPCKWTEGYSSTLFPAGAAHEAEPLMIIGPFQPQLTKTMGV